MTNVGPSTSVKPIMNLCDLRTRGWVAVSGISNKSELLELAQAFGRPTPSPTGELVKELRPTAQDRARNGTFSGTYGCGAFPLHTDTAFWPLPARYLIFRARGDIRRQTTVLLFDHIFGGNCQEFRKLVERSVWVARTPTTAIYCSMRFSYAGQVGFRYDNQCMRPANRAAFIIRDALEPFLAHDRGEEVSWQDDVAIVISNWDALHARGPSPPNEGPRLLERVYVT